MTVPITRDHLDRVGSCLSMACAIHCSLKPLLFVLPSIAWLDVMMTPRFEGALLASGIVLVLSSVTWGYSRHRNAKILMVLLLAVGLIGLGRLAVPHGWLERALIVPGGLLVALTHWINARLCRCC